MLAPAGTPPAIVNLLSSEMRKSLARPETRERLQGQGAVIIGDSPAEFAAFLKTDSARWATLIKVSRVKAE